MRYDVAFSLVAELIAKLPVESLSRLEKERLRAGLMQAILDALGSWEEGERCA